MKILISLFKMQNKTQIISRWQRSVLLGVSGAVILGVFVVFLGSTPIDNGSRILGVQGRYFLPVLPMILLGLRNNTIVITKNVDRPILYAACFLEAVTLFLLPPLMM